jgi:CO/xanthine dehydrogenase Mo-binding subunit
LHLLRHHTDIGLVAAVIGKAIEADPIGQMAEKNDVVFQRDIGSPATATAATATATATTAAYSCSAAACSGTAATTAAEACAAARGLGISDSA